MGETSGCPVVSVFLSAELMRERDTHAQKGRELQERDGGWSGIYARPEKMTNSPVVKLGISPPT